MAGIKTAGNFIFAFVLIIIGLFPILNRMSITSFDPTYILPMAIELLLVAVAALWLAIDGFGEEHIIKWLSLITAALLAIIIAIPVLNIMGWINFSLPSFMAKIENFLYVAGGVFLLIGAFIYA